MNPMEYVNRRASAPILPVTPPRLLIRVMRPNENIANARAAKHPSGAPQRVMTHMTSTLTHVTNDAAERERTDLDQRNAILRRASQYTRGSTTAYMTTYAMPVICNPIVDTKPVIRAVTMNHEIHSVQKKVFPSPAAKIKKPKGQLATFKTSPNTCQRRISIAGVKDDA